MDMNVLGSYYLDQERYTPAVLERLRNTGGTEPVPPSETSFADLLEPAKSSETEGAESRRKPVVDKTSTLYEQCEALETFLVKTLITGMRNTVQKSELFSSGFAGKMYEDMLYDEYAKDFTKNARFGLAELAYLELTGQRGGGRSGSAG